MSLPWYSINDFLLHCGGKRSPLAFGRDVLAQIDRLIPFDQGRLYILDCNGRIESAFCLGVDPEVESEYYDFYSKEDNGAYSTVAAAARFARRYPSVEQCVRNCASYDNGNFFSEYIRPNHIEHSFGLGLRDTHNALRCMFSLDRVCNAQFSEDEIEIMRIIRPHLDNLHQNFFVEPPDAKDRIQGGTSGGLTRREQEIAELLIKGVSPKNISTRLSISPTTVDKHLANMHRKLQVANRQELILKLLQMSME